MRRTAVLTILLIAVPAIALDAQVSGVAHSVNGQAGQRQVRGQALDGIAVTGRVDGRIANRVQSRIRNRIDRYYSPQANAASPFAIAGDQARAASRPARP